MHRTDLIAIGELAARTGVAVSAIRFYEAKGLIEALRTGGGQRRFLRADIRRVSFILIAQQMGLSLDDIAAELARLPAGRNPNAADWARISAGKPAMFNGRIMLQHRAAIENGVFRAGYFETDYAAFMSWRDRGHPGPIVRNGFAMAALPLLPARAMVSPLFTASPSETLTSPRFA